MIPERTTAAQWIATARTHAGVLVEFVSAWHPGVTHFPPNQTDEEFERTASRITSQPDLPITAPNAERASRGIRKDIARRVSDPVEELKLALEAGNVGKIFTILNQAWFGVPESTNCWKITGFREAVALLEDMPEEE